MALSNPSITLVMCVLLVTSLPCTSSYQLKILHTNDVHAHIQQSNARGSSCSAEQEAASLCYGGVARLKTEIDRQRSQSENTLLLDAGDQFQVRNKNNRHLELKGCICQFVNAEMSASILFFYLKPELLR